MRNKQHIKRCPFCGGKASLIEDYYGWYLVECDACGAASVKTLNYKKTLLNWNRRISDEVRK